MSCNGCRVLRKRCGEDCILRSSLNWIQSPESQANATIFVAKFFGRADLMSFISAVSDHQRSALFQSLLFEACGRTVNPVSGAIGLLCSGNWKLCQDAVEVVLAGGVLRPVHPEFLTRMLSSPFSNADRSKSAAIESGMVDFQASDLSLSPVKLERRRETTPVESDVSEGSFEDGENGAGRKSKLLNLFV